MAHIERTRGDGKHSSTKPWGILNVNACARPPASTEEIAAAGEQPMLPHVGNIEENMRHKKSWQCVAATVAMLACAFPALGQEAFNASGETSQATSYDVLGTLEGNWRFSGSEEGCDGTGSNSGIYIGQPTMSAEAFTYRAQNTIQFGDGYCYLTDISSGPDVATFHSTCVFDGEPREATGEIRSQGPTEASLYLPNMTSGRMALTRCPVASAQPVAEAVPQAVPADDGPVKRGTPFRGIALGDDRRTVNAALALLDLRCFSDDELRRFATMLLPLLETRLGLDVCRMARSTFTFANDDLAYAYAADRFEDEFRSMAIPNSIMFKNGRAVYLTLSPEFFNSNDATPQNFAQSIADNYPLPEGLVAIQGGWSGVTEAGELVKLTLPPRRTTPTIMMTVEWASPTSTPTFN